MEIKRDYYLNKLIQKENNNLIKIVTGIRRCGKSYLLFNLFYDYLINKGVSEEHIIKIALDDRMNKELRNPDNMLRFIKENIKDNELYYILIDEVQLMNEFEDVLNSLLHIKNADVYVTGSNSKFLSSDIITEFRGRGDEIKVYPLSFAEFMSVYDGDEIRGLEDYIVYGGLPLITTFKSNEEKVEYLNYQKNNVYINDVIERNNIKNDEELRTLIQIISSSIGSLTNPAKLYRTFQSNGNNGISEKTVSKYLNYLEESFLIENSKRYNVKGKKYIDTPSKYYFTDMGIRNSLIDFRQIEKTHIMENIIYIELRRRGFNVDVGVVDKREYNEDKERDYIQLEVDFIANKGYDKYYIQSVYRIDDEAKKEQELKSLLNINDSFKKFVIVYDNFVRWQDDNGIIYMSIYEFLLNEDSLKM